MSDPFLSAYRAVDQVIAWAQFRDADMVRRVAHANSHPSVVFKGLRLAAEQDQTVRVPDKGFYATSKEAEQAILEALQSGRLTAYGLENNKGDLKPVPRIQWAAMKFYMYSYSKFKKFKTYARPPDLLRPNATEWTMLQLEREQVMAVFPDPNAVDTASATENTNRQLTDTDPLAAFRQVSDLTWQEVSLTLLAHNWIEVSARGITKYVHYDALGLMSRTKRGAGEVNYQGAALIKFAIGGSPAKKHYYIVYKLRGILKKALNIQSNPFSTPSEEGWTPRFKIIDKRTARDERAKRRTKKVKYRDGYGEHTQQNQSYLGDPGAADGEEYPYEDDDEFEDERTTHWLKEHDKRWTK